jgi:hypothetical protein
MLPILEAVSAPAEAERRSVVITSGARLVLFATLAALAIGAIASSPASALPSEGPFWHVNGTRLAIGKSKAGTGNSPVGTSPTSYSKIANKEIKVACAKITSTGDIFNSTQHGEGEGKGEAKNCTVSEKSGSSFVEIKECHVAEPVVTEVRTSLWYKATNLGKTRTNILQALSVPKSGNVFATQTIEGEGCGTLEGIYKYEGSTASGGSPEYTEVEVGRVIFTSEQQKHLWLPKNSPEETQVLLLFNKTEARVEGEGEASLASKEKFGAFEK